MNPAMPVTNRICEVLEHLVDERVGIVHLVEEVHRELASTLLFLCEGLQHEGIRPTAKCQ